MRHTAIKSICNQYPVVIKKNETFVITCNGGGARVIGCGITSEVAQNDIVGLVTC